MIGTPATRRSAPTKPVFFSGAFLYGWLSVYADAWRQLWELLFLGLPCLFWLHADFKAKDQSISLLHQLACLFSQGVYLAWYLWEVRGKQAGFVSIRRAIGYLMVCVLIAVSGAGFESLGR